MAIEGADLPKSPNSRFPVQQKIDAAQSAALPDAKPRSLKRLPNRARLRARAQRSTSAAKPGDSLKVSSIHQPSLLVYLPPKEKATGAVALVLK